MDISGGTTSSRLVLYLLRINKWVCFALSSLLKPRQMPPLSSLLPFSER